LASLASARPFCGPETAESKASASRTTQQNCVLIFTILNKTKIVFLSRCMTSFRAGLTWKTFADSIGEEGGARAMYICENTSPNADGYVPNSFSLSPDFHLDHVASVIVPENCATSASESDCLFLLPFP